MIEYKVLSKTKNSEYLSILNLIDFDGTLYYNPSGKYTGTINREFIIPHSDFPICKAVRGKRENMSFLFSGRHISQTDIIIEGLESRGYYLDGYLLNPAPKKTNPFYNPTAKLSQFLVNYWRWKSRIVEKYAKVFKIVNVIDDDEIVCRLAKSKGAHTFLSKLELKNDHLTINLKRL